MDWITIFKREKPTVAMPEPKFEDNWKQEQYERNVKEGVSYLQKGKSINIYDDGRGYELAVDIKHQFMLEYQKQLSEKIKIDNKGSVITIFIKNDTI